MSDNLKWVRAWTTSIVPTYLIEQIKRKDYTVENFLKYVNSLCVKNTPIGLTLNSYSHLYVLATEDSLVKGVMWFIIEPLTMDMVLQTLSIDKDYLRNGKTLKMTIDFLKEIRDNANLKKVYWITDHERAAKKYGFKRSHSTLMEYVEPEEKED